MEMLWDRLRSIRWTVVLFFFVATFVAAFDLSLISNWLSSSSRFTLALFAEMTPQMVDDSWPCLILLQ